jgi:hypothetical protein
MMYRLCWEELATGNTGHGEPQRDWWELNRECERLNQQNAGRFRYWVEAV